jgi:hypothetical protein
LADSQRVVLPDFAAHSLPGTDSERARLDRAMIVARRYASVGNRSLQGADWLAEPV